VLQENELVTIIDYVQGDGEAYFKAALQRSLEGIMAKRLASTYQPGVRGASLMHPKYESRD
jgi:bifunctional non-homologous end joining protein LigD